MIPNQTQLFKSDLGELSSNQLNSNLNSNQSNINYSLTDDSYCSSDDDSINSLVLMRLKKRKHLAAILAQLNSKIRIKQ